MKKLNRITIMILMALISYSFSLFNNLEQLNIKLNIPKFKVSSNSSCYEDNLKTKVSNTIDGDTFEFLCNNQRYKVRIIGIDTPETKHPSKGVQCFGVEASNYTKNTLLGKEIILKKGKLSGNTDKYGRLLRYVYVNNKDFGENIINDGYAFSYKKFPHERLESYNKKEIQAKLYEKGLWNPSKCRY